MSGTLKKMHACSYEWTISNLAMCPIKPGKRICSPAFTSDILGNTKWRLVLYPKGKNNFEFISLFLQRLVDDSEMKEIVIDFKIAMDSLYSRFRFMKISRDICFVENDLIGYAEFTKWDSPELVDRVAPYDTFAVRCELSLSDRMTSDYCRWNQRMDFKMMSIDFSSLFLYGRHSDFLLVSNGWEFQVHKAVLASRSPKFMRDLMFLQGTPCQRMDVSSISPLVLKDFLLFIYSGKLEIPPSLVPRELLPIAEEYEMDDLVWRVRTFPKSFHARTVVQLEHMYHVWSADVLSALESENLAFRRSVKCSHVYCDQLSVCCQIIHDTERGNGDYINVTFSLSGILPDNPVFLMATIHLVDPNQLTNSLQELYTGHHVFKNGAAWQQSFHLNDVQLEVGNSLSLGFEFDISDGTATNHLRVEDMFVPDKCPIGLDNLRHFSSDLRTLLDDEDGFSDFEVVCGGETFRAHKSVLSARSTVFDRMLEHDMVEKITGKVVIDDVRPEIMRWMLSYMYSGVLEDGDYEDILDLYVASDKYALFILKERCHFLLVKGMNADYVADVLNLALLHCDVRLECSARRYIRVNAIDVVPSPLHLTEGIKETEV